METLIKHANGQWSIEELNKVKQADIKPWVPSPAVAPAVAPAAKPAAPAASTITAPAPTTPAPATNQGHLGEYWKAPTPGKKVMKPSPDQDYKKLTKPKPTVDNVSEVKARLQEDRRKAGLGPPPPKRGVEEMKVRQGKNEAERQVAESVVTGKPVKKK